MPEVQWMAQLPWEFQPPKRRRVSVEDLEQALVRLSLSGGRCAREDVELDVMLQTLTLQASPATSAFSSGCAAQSEFDSGHPDASGGLFAPDVDDCAVEDHAAACDAISCTAIVPLRRESRRRRGPWIAAIPRCLPPPMSIAKFAVDSKGTAFVLPEAVRQQLARARAQRKRGHVEIVADWRVKTPPTAVVVYEGLQKQIFAEDFPDLQL
mmetsp:Transcript_118623/g.335534  ORF Transcript_118623/g.335534 Transcript_118623/m.335534 type:complete len:210 (-) Transcript_118623:112-741(-)